MLNLTYLQQLATKYQTNDTNVRREYAQHLLLSHLYQKPEAESLFFKGGTALRILYRSPRFSEDLDFETTEHDQGLWERVLENLLIDLSHENIVVDIEESKITTGGYLGIVTLKNIGKPIEIHIEISFRKKFVEGEVFTVENDFTSPYSIKSLITTQLVEGKLEALFDRQKARDFYDLYFLLRSNLVPPSQKRQLSKVRHLLSNRNIDFSRELSLFLPKNQALIIKDFENSLVREIERNI
jgi:predicted nucleotidyltransferase component of viral defense system